MPILGRDEPATTITQLKISIAAAGLNEIIATPGAGKQLWIHKLMLSVARGSQTAITYQSGANELSSAMQADVIADDLGSSPMKCNTNEAFNVTLSDAVAVTGYVMYQVVNA